MRDVRRARRDEETTQVVKSSFRERGIAKLDRLDQAEMQTACLKHRSPAKSCRRMCATRIEKAALATVK